jgi:hypothetical protein
MNRPLPNTTAEAVGFTIPGRSSSLQYHTKPTSKHRKKSPIDKSRDEVAERLRSLSLGSREANIRKGTFFDCSSLSHRQILKRATSSSASTASSSAPVSLYRNSNKPKNQLAGDLSRQGSLKVKTFRAIDSPDPRNSPDISAHPANSLPGTPVGPLSESPTLPSLDAHPFNRPSGSQFKPPSEPRADAKPQLSLPPSSSLDQTVDSNITTNRAPPVTRETAYRRTENLILEQISRDIHYHHSHKYVQPVKETVFAPAQHFATGMEGKVIKIPNALGESLEMVKEQAPKQGIAGMGWE